MMGNHKGYNKHNYITIQLNHWFKDNETLGSKLYMFVYLFCYAKEDLWHHSHTAILLQLIFLAMRTGQDRFFSILYLSHTTVGFVWWGIINESSQATWKCGFNTKNQQEQFMYRTNFDKASFYRCLFTVVYHQLLLLVYQQFP